MSEMEEYAACRAEESETVQMRVLSGQEGQTMGSMQQGQDEVQASLDCESYFLGEVPQAQLLDPLACLPLNSDRLIGSTNTIEPRLAEVSTNIEEEVTQIQKFQKKINFWEDRIEKNKALIQKNESKIKQNNIDLLYDKKNRDYWFGRAEQVSLDYQNAASANREENWGWLIKKYGLKNADGTVIDSAHLAIDELCNGESNNLAGQYLVAGNKYEQSKKDREAENNRLIRDNSTYLATNETLQGYIANTYGNEIEPLQDGVLLMKELGVKFKALNQTDSKVNYGELRTWAEDFLNDFLKSNPRTPQPMVTEFRKLTSIPLPADHC